MQKPTCYLWKNNYASQAEYEKAKESCRQMGFRAVTFVNGPKDSPACDALKALIKNHLKGSLP